MTNQHAPTALFLDIGNTRTKWAFIELDSDIESSKNTGAMAHTELNQAQSHEFVQTKLNTGASPTHIVCVSVANPKITKIWQSNCQSLWPNAQWHQFSSSENSCGITNQYESPNSLGADRWAAMIGAKTKFPNNNLLIVNAGTATTIDYVNQAGAFIGGWIIPGLSMMLESLASGTADLPQLNPTNLTTISLGQSTKDCITQGCIQSQIGAIVRATEQIQNPYKLVLSGGNSGYLEPQLSKSLGDVNLLTLDKYLVLRGLQAWLNQSLKK